MRTLYTNNHTPINIGLLSRNTIYNFLGQGIPLIIAVATTPILINNLGIDRFGMLNIIWIIVGYFGLFDIGIGRATTKFVSGYLASNRLDDLNTLVWTSWLLLLFLGVAGGLVLGCSTPLLVKSLLKVPEYLVQETTISLYLISASVPVLLITSGIRGVLEAHQQFNLINITQAPSGILNYLIPIFILYFTTSLVFIVAFMILNRIITLLVLSYFCLIKTMPSLRTNPRIYIYNIGQLLSFGGWLTVTNIIGPVMVYMDRFIISTVLSLSEVTYYVVPYNIVTKLWVIPGSLLPVLFPAFTQMFTNNDNNLAVLYRGTIKYTFLVMLILSTPLVVLSHEIISIWLGTDFADHSAPVLAWLSFGVLINSLAQIPYTLIQSLGRPDITAKFHLLELPFYVGLTSLLIQNNGIVGAAISWVIRIAIDAFLLFWYANRLLPKHDQGLRFALILLPITPLIYVLAKLLSSIFDGLLGQFVIVFLIIAISTFITWNYLMVSAERERLRQGYKLLFNSIKKVFDRT